MLKEAHVLTGEAKRALLRATAEAHHLRIFVETGTYLGETVEAMIAEPRIVDQVYTVEISPGLYERAHWKFIDPGSPARDRRVVANLYDSAAFLRDLVPTLEGPALFWLDAHAGSADSGGTFENCPLRAELQAIFQCPMTWPHVVLVDDARLLGISNWPTLEEIGSILDAAATAGSWVWNR